MPLNSQQDDPNLGLNLPPKLHSDLKNLYLTNPTVSPEIDETIRFAAHDRLRDSRRNRRWAWIGVAAAACFGIFAMQHLMQPIKPAQFAEYSPDTNTTAKSVSPAAPSPQDIDHSGRIDILDALALARQIESGANLAASLDFTADGKINRSDVDAVALSAVRLKGGA